MNNTLLEHAKDFYEANPWLELEGGRILSSKEIGNISPKIKRKVPDWYIEILRTIPLAGATLGIPNDLGLPEFQDKPLLKCPSMWVKFLTLEEILESVTENEPDNFLFDYNYLPILHYDNVGMNICIKYYEENPALILFFPSWYEKLSDLEDESEIILPKFSDLFHVARNTSFLPEDEVDF